MNKALIALTGIVMASGAAAQAPQGGRGLAGADADGDGIVTRAEVTAQGEARFARLDADKNGTVTPEEMQAGMGGGGGAYGGGAANASAGAGGGGRPGGGMAGPMSKEQYLERSLGRFDAADANKDGKLDKDELAAAQQGGRPAGAGQTAGTSPGN